MDIYKFIKSKAIREHCKKIGREFTPPESAYLIWKSDLHMSEKHAAWSELIETTRDCEAPGHKSLHEFLRRHMEQENGLIEELRRKDENADYYIDTDAGSYSEYGVFYRDYENCFSAALASRIYRGHGWVFLHKVYNKDGSDEEIRNMRNIVGKIIAAPDGSAIISEVTIGIYTANWHDFRALAFRLPVPFKSGDILYNPYGTAELWQGNEQPLVFDHIGRPGNTCDASDCTDLSATTYSQCDLGIIPRSGVKHMHLCDYSDLEYYPLELQASERVLKAFSSYLKGDISLEVLVNAYYVLMLESEAAMTREDVGRIFGDERGRIPELTGLEQSRDIMDEDSMNALYKAFLQRIAEADISDCKYIKGLSAEFFSSTLDVYQKSGLKNDLLERYRDFLLK